MSRTRIPLDTLRNPQADLAERLDMSTAEIGLSVRTTNCLEERGIFTVNDLLHCTREDLLEHLEFRRKDAGRGVQGTGKHRLLSPQPPGRSRRGLGSPGKLKLVRPCRSGRIDWPKLHSASAISFDFVRLTG